MTKDIIHPLSSFLFAPALAAASAVVELLLSTFGPKKNDRIRLRIIIALNVLYSKLE